MILIKGVEVFAPQSLGKKDVMITHDKITVIGEDLLPINDDMKVIDGKDKILIPGFIDGHVHITGGGGEGSFKTRVPEIMLSKLIQGGVTTVLGLLGTDGTTRSVENLVAKAKALNEEGVTSLVVTGSYGYPSVTVTGSVRKDITFIDEVVGVKVAISDHRSSSLSLEELARLASEARVAGMISGKAGIVITHMGDGDGGLKPVFDIIKKWDIPLKTIRPTHVNRKKELLEESLEYAKMGGIIDLTSGYSGDENSYDTIVKAKEMGIDLNNITISSDGYGSWSDYDEQGNLVRIGVSPVDSIHKELVMLVKEYGMDIEEALRFFTSNVAKALGIYPRKGNISQGSDGDLLLLNKDLELEYVIAKGKVLMEEGKVVVKGTYE